MNDQRPLVVLHYGPAYHVCNLSRVFFAYIKRGTLRNLREPTRAASSQGFSLCGGSSYAKDSNAKSLRGLCRHTIPAYAARSATKKTSAHLGSLQHKARQRMLRSQSQSGKDLTRGLPPVSSGNSSEIASSVSTCHTTSGTLSSIWPLCQSCGTTPASFVLAATFKPLAAPENSLSHKQAGLKARNAASPRLNTGRCPSLQELEPASKSLNIFPRSGF